MKITLLPFLGNENKCVSGETKLEIKNCGDRIYLAHHKTDVAYIYEGKIIGTHVDNCKISIESPTKYIPHDKKSFDRYGWYRFKNPTGTQHGREFGITSLNDVGIFTDPFGSIIYADALELIEQIHEDGTTSPCGQEV